LCAASNRVATYADGQAEIIRLCDAVALVFRSVHGSNRQPVATRHSFWPFVVN
jgi:hypothetical protein